VVLSDVGRLNAFAMVQELLRSQILKIEGT
jgi:hypothetical protein